MLAVSLKDKTKVSLLLAQDSIDVNAENILGHTPLLQAVLSCDVEIVELLLNHDKINIHAVPKVTTLLRQAILKNDNNIVKLLLNHKDIYINRSNNEEETALMIAALNDKRNIVEQLLARKEINIEKQNKRGYTASTIVRAKGNTEIADMIEAKQKLHTHTNKVTASRAISTPENFNRI